MSNQTQVTTTIPSLTALLQHPDFQAGVADAEGCFNEWYREAPLTEGQMITEVEENLTRSVTERDKEWATAIGNGPSYMHHLGFVLGTIAKGLTYASPASL